MPYRSVGLSQIVDAAAGKSEFYEFRRALVCRRFLFSRKGTDSMKFRRGAGCPFQRASCWGVVRRQWGNAPIPPYVSPAGSVGASADKAGRGRLRRPAPSESAMRF